MQPLQFGVVEAGIDQFVDDITAAIPRVLAGIVFLVIAAVLGKVLITVVRLLLRRALPGDSDVYRRFISGIVAAFLWFGVALSFLAIVGLDGIASSLGTAAGFLALGVSYSLSSMIADAVAGVYLLRDPDFMPGDRVKVGDAAGTVKSIELRKTRFTDEAGDTLVRGNAEIEKKWTKLEDAEEAASGGDDATSGDETEEVREEVAEATSEQAEDVAESASGEAEDAAETASETVGDAAEDAVDGDSWSDATDR